MTHEESDSSAQQLSSHAIEAEIDSHHDPYQETNMSELGQHESIYTVAWNVSGDWLVQGDGEEPDRGNSGARATAPTPNTRAVATQTTQDEFSGTSRPTKRARVPFHEFATQSQLLQHHRNKYTRLRRRKRTLERSIALSARLRRTSHWIRDGLVEMSKHNEEQPFARVYEHAHNLVDVCVSRWNHDLQTAEVGDAYGRSELEVQENAGFFDQLSSNAQSDLLDLLSTLRTKPQFLIDKLRSLPPSQAATLNKYPRWDQSAATSHAITHERVRTQKQQQRLRGYAKDVEDYANSFERSNTLSFLLHSLYSPDASVNTFESRLRLDVWSTICAELQNSAAPSYNILLFPILSAFATIHGWPAKVRVELFLMDFLQKGAFLLTDVPDSGLIANYNPFATARACEFFDRAMSDLLVALIESEGGLPTGALALARAIMGKLSTDQQQQDFRGHFFVTWFLNHFLRIVVFYPENENMLLKVHISNSVRRHLLLRLVEKTIEKAEKVLSNPDAFQDMFSDIVLNMAHSIENGHEIPNLHTSTPRNNETRDRACTSTTIVLCATEIVKLLESLSRQVVYSDTTMDTMNSVFQGQYATASNRYDLLKNELILTTEPGSSAQDIHPCMEKWSDFKVQRDGTLRSARALEDKDAGVALELPVTLDTVQEAAANLCDSERATGSMEATDVQYSWGEHDKLYDLFNARAERCRALTKTKDEVYWRNAMKQLRQRYHLASVGADDTEILRAPLHQVNVEIRHLSDLNTAIETSMLDLEQSYRQSRTMTEHFTTSLAQLRLKFYYTSRLTTQQSYQDARSVTSALNNMYMSQSVRNQSSPTRNESSTRLPLWSPINSPPSRQHEQDTIQMLKAPTEHGGPKKLADVHIFNTRRWLQKNHVENFCTGEERIHRFCMEVSILAQKFATESTQENSDLWASYLFGRERLLHDYISLSVNSAPASTRPASIRSDAGSGTFPFARSPFRSTDSDTRSTLSDDRGSYKRGSLYSMFPRTLNPSLLPSDLASSIGSHGRGSSAPTSVSEIFSQAAPSITSYSAHSHSRPASIYQESLAFRSVPAVREKARFLESIQQGLVCLLLSDLGSLVWSWGSETDSWIFKVQQTEAVATRLARRVQIEDFTSAAFNRERPKLSGGSFHSSKSTENFAALPSRPPDASSWPTSDDGSVDYPSALADALTRLSQHVDPLDKLSAVEDFHHLIMEQLKSSRTDCEPYPKSHHLPEELRRNSLDSQLRRSSLWPVTNVPQVDVTDTELTLQYRKQFSNLRPSTMFRDLQYVSAFVPSEVLAKTPQGRAFLQFGVAALAYKTELCRCMVHVAAGGTDTHDQAGFRSSDYWRIAAAENNAVAQRELAMLYLSQPGTLPIFSMPMTLATDVFKDNLTWEPDSKDNTNREALCLALHWMQRASDNDDPIARRELEQRTRRILIQ